MRRRTLSVSLLGIVSAMLLVACGGGGAGSSTVSTASTTRPPTNGDSTEPHGSLAPSGEVRAAESTLASFFEARAKEDWKAGCSFLSSSIRRQLEKLAKGIGGKAKGCASVLAMSSKGETAAGLGGPPIHALTSLRVEGDKAFALWVGPHGQKYAMPMVRERGDWRPAEVAPIPDPAGGER